MPANISPTPSVPLSVFIHRIHAIHSRLEVPFIATFLGELAGLAFIFLFWLSGAGVASVRISPSRVLFFSDSSIHPYSVNVGQPPMVYAGLSLSASHGYRRVCVARMARGACLAF